CLETFDGPAGSILAIDTTRDGRWIATGTHERQVVLWDASSRRGTALPGEMDAIVLGGAFDPDGARLYALDSAGTLVAWDVADDARAWELRLEGNGANALARDPSGARLAVGGSDGSVRLVDTRAGRVAAVLEGRAGRARCVAFDPRGAVVSGGEDGV